MNAIAARVPTVERLDIHLSVPLDSPVKASPTTGMTGAPHPITVQPPVARPHTLAAAPTAPPWPVALTLQLDAGVCARRYIHRAKYAPTSADIDAKRARSAVVTAKPHSMPRGLSEENQKRARSQTLPSRWWSEPGPDITKSGSLLSQGFHVK